MIGTLLGLVGFHRTATRDEPGTVSLSISNRLVAVWRLMALIPVTLRPGRARLSIRPVAAGSAAIPPITIGTVLVARAAAKTAGVPEATISSTLRSTSSAARAGSWSPASAKRTRRRGSRPRRSRARGALQQALGH